MDQKTAKKLIDKTRNDYNLIAEQFASTRQFNWGDFAAALRSIPIKRNTKVLDLGCGNGRVYELLAEFDVDFYGLDLSDELIKIAKKRVPKGHFQQGNLLQTPYKNEEFDVVICAATLHHIPGKDAREQAIKEIYRITKPCGYVLMTFWYFWNKPQYLRGIAKTAFAKLGNKTELDIGDFFMVWKRGDGTRVTRRYFHAWRKSEISNLLKKTGFNILRVSLFFKQNKKVGNNLIAIAQKPE